MDFIPIIAEVIRLPKTLFQLKDVAVPLNNLEKVYWPEEGITKGELIEYYMAVSQMLLPHLKDRPLTLRRLPDGIEGKEFYQKEKPDYAPAWLKTAKIISAGKGNIINYCLCNDKASLAWLVGQGCVEMHPWLSTYDHPDYPDLAVIDLDPSKDNSFEEVCTVAKLVKQILDDFQLQGYPKTSGATGIHIYIPLERGYTYQQVQQATGFLVGMLAKAFSEKTTVARSVSQRGSRIYLDYLQNARGQTVASIYSVRPLPGAPVSTPLSWSELDNCSLNPRKFNLKTSLERFRTTGDLFLEIFNNRQSIDHVLNFANGH